MRLLSGRVVLQGVACDAVEEAARFTRAAAKPGCLSDSGTEQAPGRSCRRLVRLHDFLDEPVQLLLERLGFLQGPALCVDVHEGLVRVG